MNGQWIGSYSGSSKGTIVVNIDDRRTFYRGVAYFNESDGQRPSIAAFFRTRDKSSTAEFRTDTVQPINPFTGVPDAWDRIKTLYGDRVGLPEYADVTANHNGDELTLTWTTNLGSLGKSVLPRSRAAESSELASLGHDWSSFKTHVAGLEGRRFLFRGQTKPWRLRTSFHRAGRADLVRFVNEDVQVLHKHLSARTRHVFNLEIPRKALS